MRGRGRVWWRLVVAGVHEAAAYRLALLGGLVANVTFGFLKYGILTATVAASGGVVAGYDAQVMSTYIWLSQGMLGSVNLFGRTDLSDRVKNGDVAVDFLRPLSVQAAACLHDIGRGLFALLPRGLPSVAIGALLVGIALPSSAAGYLLGAVSVLLAIAVSATTVYLVAVSGFWLVETRGLQVLYMVTSGFFAGLFVPVGLLPGWLQVAAYSTPFPAMMMYPVDVLSGRVAGWAAAGLVAAQLGWLLATVAVGAAMTVGGRRRLEVQGG
ncbi:ABC-2 family transporter protein [Kineosporia sp. A_224]|uniref:ABC transporter permease n=1 Tax=Kineosporia sp. A_224 TaxID=1962180 RepID=UPI000B4C1953|nr:ABC-2 family transporter protein [Kineosporia sp. A_224]